MFLALAWFLNGAETPHYAAPDHDWITWANNTEMKGRFAAFFALLAGLAFLPYAATIRGWLGTAEEQDSGSTRLTQIAYAGGLIGVTSFTIATVTFSGASAEGAQAKPDVSRAIATGDVGPFLVAPMGFAAFLGGRRTGDAAHRRAPALDSSRRTGRRGLVRNPFLTTLDGTADGSVFGYGFFPGIVALLTWSIATSIATYRAVGRPAAESTAMSAHS